MKIKTSELSGAALDYTVAKLQGVIGEDIDDFCLSVKGEFEYSTSWNLGGPIIEREKLCIGYQHQLDPYYSPLIDSKVLCWARTTAGGYLKYGPSSLIAAMRCYVASKLGDEIEIPDEISNL